MRRRNVLLVLLLASPLARADGILKLGTYELSHDAQFLGGENVRFYDMPSATVGLALEAAPLERIANLSYGVEVFHVAYDIDQQGQSIGDGQMSNSALLANFKWRLFPQAIFRPFVGVGAGLAYVDFDMRETASYHSEESLGLAGQAFGGLEWQAPRSRFGLLGELKYYGASTNVDAAGTAAFLGFSMRLD